MSYSSSNPRQRLDKSGFTSGVSQRSQHSRHQESCNESLQLELRWQKRCQSYDCTSLAYPKKERRHQCHGDNCCFHIIANVSAAMRRLAILPLVDGCVVIWSSKPAVSFTVSLEMIEVGFTCAVADWDNQHSLRQSSTCKPETLASS